MLLSIIIVNYKTPDLLSQCIQSILQTIPMDWQFEIIVIDNNSNDNSKTLITTQFHQVIWIQKPENDGFGRANNAGILQSKGKYLLLLNSDMILQPNTLQISLNHIQSHPNTGVLSCKILNQNLSPQKSTYFSNGKASFLLHRNLIIDYLFQLHKKHLPIKAVMGCFMLIPKEVLSKSGLFDPDFFMFSEEIDLCRRITKQNYEISVLNEATAIHLFGKSTSNILWANKQRHLSNALLHLKYGGIPNYFLFHLYWHVNLITNLFALWFLDKNYRKGFFSEQKYYFSNLIYFMRIPFQYKSKPGNGKRLLRRS